MFSVEQYINAIKENLEKQSDVLIDNLKNIFDSDFSRDIELLDFTGFMEPTRFEFSITMYSMDKNANEVFYDGKDATVFAGSAEVFPEIEYHQVNASQLGDFFNFYEQNETTIIPLEERAFVDWFKQCWKKAGGDILRLPSYFILHDQYQSFDLKNNQWIDDDEKWS